MRSAQSHIVGCGLLILSLFSGRGLYGQDYTWWNQKHNWDGVTHWTRYIILSPGFMGPNALPVPETRNGIVDTSLHFSTSFEIHRSEGDKTENNFTTLFIPIANGIAGLGLEMVTWEHYRMDTLTRDARRSRDEDGIGTAIGDLQVSTLIRLARNHPNWPDMNLGIHLRTATGSNLGGARFSDAPGYAFDLACSKKLNNKAFWLEPYCVLGFGAWQVNRDDNLQNDVFRYALGTKAGKANWYVGVEWSGYHGYFDNGDRPMVGRLNAMHKVGKHIQLFIKLQQGFHDYAYSSLRLGVRYTPGITAKRSTERG